MLFVKRDWPCQGTKFSYKGHTGYYPNILNKDYLELPQQDYL